MKHGTAIIVFARAPRLGRVKTRLIPVLGAQGALDLYRVMLRHALSIARQCAPDELILSCAPDARDAELQAMGSAVGAKLQAQCGGDLGARMHHALRAAFDRHRIALLIGSDCPSLRSVDLCEARDWLVAGPHGAGIRANAMVFIPATDGGYVLVGGTRSCAEIFRDVPWGSGEVMKTTRRRLQRDGCQWTELQAHADVDRPEDLANLPAALLARVKGAPIF